jgi:hypothetical protein
VVLIFTLVAAAADQIAMQLLEREETEAEETEEHQRTLRDLPA